MSALENGEISDMEYLVEEVATVYVCQVCTKIFTSALAIDKHNIDAHQMGIVKGLIPSEHPSLVQ